MVSELTSHLSPCPSGRNAFVQSQGLGLSIIAGLGDMSLRVNSSRLLKIPSSCASVSLTCSRLSKTM